MFRYISLFLLLFSFEAFTMFTEVKNIKTVLSLSDNTGVSFIGTIDTTEFVARDGDNYIIIQVPDNYKDYVLNNDKKSLRIKGTIKKTIKGAFLKVTSIKIEEGDTK